MKSKLTALLIMVAMLLTFGTVAMATPVYFGQISVTGGGATGGGPFNVTPANSSYSFQSFCLETDEYLASPSHTYTAYTNSEAVRGGYNTNANDPLDPRTAYLYVAYLRNWIPNMNVNALQVAIWMLEDEFSVPGNSMLSRPSVIANWAEASQYVAMANAAGWTTTGGVSVLNLTYTNQSGVQKAQDLIYVPEPLSLLLLGFGLIGLGVARKLKK